MREEQKKLLDMVKKGVPGKEIMNELAIKTKTTLKKMYYDALVESGKIKDIKTARQVKKEEKKEKTLRITKRGTLTLSKKLLIDDFGFKEGDRFTVSKRKENIALRKETEQK
ncbi:MAG: hypothetical protein ACOC6B_01930 [Thermodesulfobacteriota bacterium]